MTQPKAFRYALGKLPVSRHLRDNAVATEAKRIMTRASEYAAELAADKNWSDDGRRSEFTKSVMPLVLKLNEQEKKISTARRELEKKAAALRESAQPRAATQAERDQLIALATMARESPENRNYVLGLMSKHNPTPAEYARQLAFCSIDPALFGPEGAAVAQQMQTLVQMRLAHEVIGDDISEIDETAERLHDETEAVRAARLSIIGAADRDQLHAAGLIPKPVSAWTEDEKRAFLRENGYDAYARVLYEDSQLGASATQDRIQGMTFQDGIPDAEKAHEVQETATAAQAAASALAAAKITTPGA